MTNSGTEELEISIPSSYDAMEKVAAMIERAGDQAGISEDDEVDLMISVMEAVNNAIDMPLEEGLLEEQYLFQQLLRTPEAQPTMRRFLEIGGQTRDGEMRMGELAAELNAAEPSAAD